MPKRPPKKSADIPEWVVTYGDLMSLLLCFFILLAAFSELKQPKEYQKVIDSIREALGVDGGEGIMDLDDMLKNVPLDPQTYLKPQLDPNVNQAVDDDDNVDGRAKNVSVLHDAQRWTPGGALFFTPGSTELTPQSKHTLDTQIIPRVKDIRFKVLVRGHAYGVTDITTNLDLEDMSYKRASAVRNYLIDQGEVNPLNLTIVACGSTEPMVVPARPTDNADVNRRVEVYVSDVTIDQTHPDPDGTGRGRED